MNYLSKLFFLILPLLVSIFFGACNDFTGLGTSDNPVIIQLMPAKNNRAVNNLANALQTHLKTQTNLQVFVLVAPDTYSIINGFEKKTTHMAFINTFGYIIAHYWGDAEARLRLVFRSGKASYQGQIIVRADSAINTPADLNGKSFAYKDPFSTSGFVLPLLFMQKHQIKPASTVLTGSYYKTVRGVYDGTYDAGAIYYDTTGPGGTVNDARKELLLEFPDVLSKIKLLSTTGSIKSSPVAIHRQIPKQLQEQLIKAITIFAELKSNQQLLLSAYDVTGFKKTNNADYNDVRQMIKKIGYDSEELIPRGSRYILRKRVEILTDRIP